MYNVIQLKTGKMHRSTVLIFFILLFFISDISSSDQEDMGTYTNMGLRILKRGGTQFERIMKTKGEEEEWRNMKRNIHKTKENDNEIDMIPVMWILKL